MVNGFLKNELQKGRCYCGRRHTPLKVYFVFGVVFLLISCLALISMRLAISQGRLISQIEELQATVSVLKQRGPETEREKYLFLRGIEWK